MAGINKTSDGYYPFRARDIHGEFKSPVVDLSTIKIDGVSFEDEYNRVKDILIQMIGDTSIDKRYNFKEMQELVKYLLLKHKVTPMVIAEELPPVKDRDAHTVYLKYSDIENDGVYGVEINYITNKITRIGDSINLNGGADFDNKYPWNMMERVNKDGNIMSRIPQFYYRQEIIQSSAEGTGIKIEIEKRMISSKPRDGFKPFFDYDIASPLDTTLFTNRAVYISSYECSMDGDKVVSKPNVMGELICNDINELMQKCRNNGNRYFMMDLTTLSAIQWLYLIEYANFDIQTTVGKGNTYSESIIETGLCDEVYNSGVHTGSSGNDDGTSSVIYRGIENLYGNRWSYISGIVRKDNDIYISGNNPYEYNFNSIDNYQTKCPHPSNTSAHISCLNNIDKHMLPIALAVNGATPVIPDNYYCYSTIGTYQYMFGGWAGNYGDAGLWAMYSKSYNVDMTRTTTRLIYIE